MDASIILGSLELLHYCLRRGVLALVGWIAISAPAFPSTSFTLLVHEKLTNDVV